MKECTIKPWNAEIAYEMYRRKAKELIDYSGGIDFRHLSHSELYYGCLHEGSSYYEDLSRYNLGALLREREEDINAVNEHEDIEQRIEKFSTKYEIELRTLQDFPNPSEIRQTINLYDLGKKIKKQLENAKSSLKRIDEIVCNLNQSDHRLNRVRGAEIRIKQRYDPEILNKYSKLLDRIGIVEKEKVSIQTNLKTVDYNKLEKVIDLARWLIFKYPFKTGRHPVGEIPESLVISENITEPENKTEGYYIQKTHKGWFMAYYPGEVYESDGHFHC